MKAMILAAGQGARLRPLTDTVPKPLIEVGDGPLIDRHIARLRRAGVTELVINHGRLGQQIEAHLGDGAGHNVSITYSAEGDEPLETGGGIRNALPLLGAEPFIIVNADIWSDFPFDALPIQPDALAHLVLVDNPDHNPDGDFGLRNGYVMLEPRTRFTYSGIAVLRAELFDECSDQRFGLAPLLRHAAAQGLVTGERFTGLWLDVGTPERLALARVQAAAGNH
ncbi:MAG: nucleotidyltransferase family protein [Gammaproteobacteria bacterium]|nr:nucleotidyltransferase family protein [Gammaproteobacteria bacterium]NNL99132.1 nucleotidyltransferase family protein [Gammaproteobacteria bacterium]